MKLIDGYSNYYITEDGKVWNDRKKMFLKPRLNKGYLYIILCKNSKHRTFKIHRLVGIAYILNPENKPEINHIDGIKTHNESYNLEWSTRSENNLHRYKTGLFKPTEKMIAQSRINGLNNRGISQKRKLVINLETGIFYDNVKQAALSTGVVKENYLARMITGERKNKTSFIAA